MSSESGKKLVVVFAAVLFAVVLIGIGHEASGWHDTTYTNALVHMDGGTNSIQVNSPAQFNWDIQTQGVTATSVVASSVAVDGVVITEDTGQVCFNGPEICTGQLTACSASLTHVRPDAETDKGTCLSEGLSYCMSYCAGQVACDGDTTTNACADPAPTTVNMEVETYSCVNAPVSGCDGLASDEWCLVCDCKASNNHYIRETLQTTRCV